MAYIGKTPTSGDFVLLDSITTSATASYTMQKNSVNFEPQSANHMIVSLNGTIQAPVSSFTVSGSTLTFASALTSSDVIDFILVLGNVNDVGTATTVVDSAITRGKLNLISDGSNPSLIAKGDGSSVEGKIQFNCENNSHGQTIQASPHSAGQSWTLKLPDNSPTADKFLKVKSITGSGATATGQLEFADAGGNAGTESFSVGLSGNQTLTNNTWTKITFNSEEFDVGSNFASNKFTAPSSGKYVFTHGIYMWVSGGNDWENYSVRLYKNGSGLSSTYSQFSLASANLLEVAIPASFILDLSANDYIEVYAKLSSSGATSRQVDATSRFQGYKLA